MYTPLRLQWRSQPNAGAAPSAALGLPGSAVFVLDHASLDDQVGILRMFFEIIGDRGTDHVNLDLMLAGPLER
jgi:hypothetical protein